MWTNNHSSNIKAFARDMKMYGGASALDMVKRWRAVSLFLMFSDELKYGYLNNKIFRRLAHRGLWKIF